MITQRAVLLGFVGFCFYLIALVNSLPGFYYALTWLAVGLLVSSLGVAMLSLVAVKCRWSIARSKTTENVEKLIVSGGPVLRVYLENGGTLNKTGLLLEVRLRPTLNDGKDERGRVQLLSRKILIEALPSGTSLEAMVPLHDVPRGRYHVEDLRLTGSDVLGLFRARRKLAAQKDESAEIVVGPAVLAVNQAAWRENQAGHLPGDIEARFRIGQGEELRGIRPYTPGDDLRQVHWSSTARVGQLVVKEFHHRGRGAALVIWDGAAYMDWGNGEALEWGLRLTGSLARNLSASGAPCVVARLDAQPVILEGFSGESLATAVIDTLADAQADRLGDLTSAAARIRGSFEQVFVVTASLSPELSGVLARWTGAGGGTRRVTVGLINGFALGRALRDRRFSSRALIRSAPQQIVEAPSGSAAGRSQIPVTAEAYREQAERLQRIGARVVMVEPSFPDPEKYFLPIGRALDLMLSTSEIPVFAGPATADV